MRNNYSQEMIEVLFDKTIDPQRLVIEIAKTNPAAIVAAAGRLRGESEKDRWKDRAKTLIAAGKYVEAIKHCRNQTGLGLKEAKDEVDCLRATI